MSHPDHQQPRSNPAERNTREAAHLSPDDPQVIQALEEYTAALREGHSPDRKEFESRHPELAEALAECLDGLEFIRALGPRLQDAIKDAQPVASPYLPEIQPEGPLGDYRLVREIGRGGMGVVYEAVQISLGRRVALKVLPFAAALDAKQLQRFKNEAQAAAHLHHTNIVPVHSVGVERGVHYYAMQFIEGQTLAALIRDLRRLSGLGEYDPGNGAASSELAAGLALGRFAPGVPAAAEDQLTAPYLPLTGQQSSPTPDTPPVAALSTEHSTNRPAYFRTIVNLAVQAAAALEHAHQLGVIHRDVKPANLLLDLRGNLWITDFGLAQCQSQAGLTMTGDLVGTLRYMSPEQALAKRVLIDQRTDIYSLGATLYELLTLEPTFNGRDRQELLRQIAFEEPTLPSRINPSIPAELETIVLKALAKNPEERYATAKELADDLERFLADKPIKAKRPTLPQKVKKWARRNRAVVWSTGVSVGVMALLLIVGLLVAYLSIARKQAEVDSANKDLIQANRGLADGNDALQANAYVYQIALAQRELEANNAVRAEQLLEACSPGLRGWEWNFVKRLVHEEPFLLSERYISCVAFSPNSQVLAASRYDGTVQLWDPTTGKLLRTLPGDRPLFEKIAFRSDGQLLAAASWSEKGIVKVWDLAAGQERLLQGHKGRVSAVAFSPDGRYLTSGGADKTAIIWDLRNDEKMVLIGHGDEICSAAYSPDGARLATASEDRSVRIWDARTGRLLSTLVGHLGRVTGVAYSRPDGQYLATASSDRTVRLWDASTGEALRTLTGHGNGVNAVGFSPDGRRLASAGLDGTVRIWEPATGRETLTLRGHVGGAISVAFSPDGCRLASGGEDLEHSLRIWNATKVEDSGPQPLQTFAEHTAEATCLTYSRDGSLLASGSEDKTVRVRSTATGTVIHVLRSPRAIAGVAFSPDGAYLAADGSHGSLDVWNARTGQEIWGRARTASPYDLSGLVYSPDGRRLALGDYGNFVHILDAATGDELSFLNGHISMVKAVAYRPDGRRLAAACSDKQVRIWDTGSKALSSKAKLVQLLMGHEVEVNSVAYRFDGKFLASADLAGWLLVWNATPDNELKEAWRIHAHRDEINSVAFSPDGRRLATASRDGTVKLWDAATGGLIRTLHARQREVNAVALHPSGKTLASAGADGSVKIWEVPP